MPHRLILQARQFQLPIPKSLSTVIKNIFDIMPPTPMSNRVKLNLKEVREINKIVKIKGRYDIIIGKGNK